MMIRIAVQLASLKLPLRRAIAVAAELGARGVEFDVRSELPPDELSKTGVRQLRKTLDDFGLGVSAVSFPTQRGYNVTDQLDRRIEATKRAMQFAYELGASAVVNSVGRIPAECEGPEWDLLIEVLSDLGRFADRAGARLTHRTGAEDGATLAALISALPEGAIGVDLDPGGLIINGFSPQKVLDTLGERIIHVHARDGVRDLAQGRGLEVPLGRGSADFPMILGTLEQHAYRGWLTVERRSADDPVREIGDAVRFLTSLAEQ